jgi:hypothetical protein
MRAGGAGDVGGSNQRERQEGQAECISQHGVTRRLRS